MLTDVDESTLAFNTHQPPTSVENEENWYGNGGNEDDE